MSAPRGPVSRRSFAKLPFVFMASTATAVAGLARSIVKKGLRNPSATSRQRTHGFRARMATRNGRLVINRRRSKGRTRLAVSGR